VAQTKPKIRKVPVSERALVQRVNRKLAEKSEPERLCRTRPTYDTHGRDPDDPIYNDNLGRFYTIFVNRNCIAHTHVEIEALARELGALAPYEELASVT
jgi:hypothetical protein